MAKVRFLAARNLPDQVMAELEIPLRAREADVPQVAGELGQSRGEIGTLFVPPEETDRHE
jgi:hypothetical protein